MNNSINNQNDEDLTPPHAASLVESLRSFGYDLATALADLADNSLFHQARNIRMTFHWAGERSAIAIADDGAGMAESVLVEAMRVGSQNPRQERAPADLGRFGLGLKTASFSQSRRVTVITRQIGDEECVRCWDLDHIAAFNEWRLLRTKSDLAERLTRPYAQMEHGTVVLWENLDRLTAGTEPENDADEDAFLHEAERVRDHFAAVFHRFMSGVPPVHFFLNGNKIAPWDPFLVSEPATQHLPVERLNYKGHTVEVEPFVLPHGSKLTPERHAAAAGLKGWNAQQGFYVYRGRRLLVPGEWLNIKGWKQEEHYKLARIRVDLPNAIDLDWSIDVTKSRAVPPEKIRGDLARIGERTRSVAKRVYTYRGARLTPTAGDKVEFVWEQRARYNKVSYRINRDHPLVKQLTTVCGDAPKLRALLRLIEETIPVPLIMITDRERPDQAPTPFGSAKDSEILYVMRQAFQSIREAGFSHEEALLRLSHLDPFPHFPHLLQTLVEDKRE